MNRHLQNIQDFIQQADHLSAEEKAALLKSVKDADSAFAISEFKLERTEKVKRTTAILLEETIEELEQKRKAVEQQNRELEIESALERVRARTMAMQKSTELQDAALELVQQIKKLGVPSFACGFNIWDDDKKEATAWMAGDGRMQPPFKTSSSEDVFVHIREAAQKGEQLFVAEQDGDELEKHYGYMATIPEFKKVMDKMAKAGLSVPAFQIMHCAFFSQGYLMFISFEKVPEAHDIFKRFAKVFEQTYTRFLDLQKSEAQARESKIQLALERVRARTMAMQHSNELKDAAALLFQQAKTLGVPAYSCGYNIWEKNEKTFTSWMSTQDGSDFNGVPHIPLTEDANFIRFNTSKEKGEEFFVLELRGERMQEHYEYLKTIPAFKAYFDYAISVGFDLPDTQIHHLANFLHGNLLFITLEPCPEFHEVFKRFAKVFEQTYTRFLDLQKAEAQAKEAEIALALERVRARTMAMQNSDELREAVLVINEQLQQLNFDSKACNIIIIDKDTGDSQYWVSGFTKDVYPVSYNVPHLDHPYYEELLQPWKRGEQYVVYEYTNEGKKSFDKIFFTETGFKNIPEEPKNVMMNLPSVVLSTAFFSNGAIQVIGLEGISEEKSIILQRFAKVFDQTYTRFLDLKKAEEQAKEAQIEAALERVRSRTMGMQKSDELKEVIQVVYDQFVYLNIHVEHTGFVMDYKARDDYDIWIADQLAVPSHVTIPYFDCVYYNRFNEAKRKGEDFFASNLDFEEKNRFYQKIIEYIPGLPEETKEFLFSIPGLAGSTVLLDNVCLYIENFEGIPYTDEENDTLMRFGKVFQQTYTRFLDLQKSEAQAAETKIELSLERVRAKTMAMHNSADVAETVALMFDELLHLGISKNARCGIGILDPDDLKMAVWTAYAQTNENVGLIVGELDMNTHIMLQQVYSSWKSRETHSTYTLTGEDGKNYYRAINQMHNYNAKFDIETLPIVQYQNAFYFKEGIIYFFSLEQISIKTADILKRFAKVFGQTYTRYLDLLKAEAQAREAQVETALERVRGRSMAMHKSDELADLSLELVKQVHALGVDTWFCAFNIYDEDGSGSMEWGSNGEGTFPRYTTPRERVFLQYYEAGQRGETLHVNEITESECAGHYDYLCSLPGVGEQLLKMRDAGIPFPKSQIDHVAFFKYGYILFITYEPALESHDIFKRFAKVFEQTYTRFLDLQKAEAQARESQIEAALEKVRSRTLAMRTTKELGDVVVVIVEKLKDLAVVMDANGVVLCTYFPDSQNVLHWIASPDFSVAGSYLLPYFDHPILRDAWASKNSGIDYFSKAFSIEEKNSFFEYAFEYSDYKNFPEEFKHWIFQNDKHTLSFAWQKNSAILIPSHTGIVPDEAQKEILKRFANVFEQAYIRFLDLQKAEAQARESQIEVALERVRSRTMSMFKSSELADAAEVLFQQLSKLGEIPDRISIGIIDEANYITHVYATDQAGTQLNVQFIARNDERTTVKKLCSEWKAGSKTFVVDLHGDELNEWIHYIREELGMPISDEYFHGQRFHNLAFFSQGWLNLTTILPLPAEAFELLERFAKVFNLTYTRFLDLQKAEAQARESQIEAALERVRSRTLAMHKSDELAETSAVLFQQLIQLGIEPNRLYINIIKDEAANAEFWITDEDGSKVSSAFETNMNENSTFKKMYKGWNEKKKSLVIDMQGKELQEYFAYLSSINVPFKDGLSQTRRVQQLAYFNNGFIGIASPDEQSEETIKLLERFAAVFNLTYTRFHDLQFAEAQTHKANIEVALERVRARALAMQQPEELVEVAEVMRHEMGLLGVEELETSSIYINKENPDQAECWYSLKGVQGTVKNKVADHFDLNYNDTWVGKQMFNFYEADKKETSIIMQGENRREWINYCAKLSPVFQGYYGEVIPERTYHLCKFSNGAIGAATPGEISDESWELLRRAASVFSLAYSRFKDLTKARTDLQQLKEEKQRAETALTDLRATQTQLIQAEKMASLGELTAGIAHEIQNPLNFVNNFSEVSNELIVEMNAELMKGDIEEAKVIANDILQNLEKINHHGKRAADIVKGMLQHSRSSSSTKESTDINKLVDEYLRLAYHGLRAKDKIFNASLKTDFDETVGKINIIPQDLGRVILNLITNAFYVVNEKKQQQLDGYEPTVSVSTKKLGDKVEVGIKDNGNGIPQKVLDKIFQPFFTTKPTGQGTGLGLSLAYDIVKAHGGEIKVDTVEGKGTEFIIVLTVN